MKPEEKRIKCLKRRLKFLLLRTDNGTNKLLSYDCEEIIALKWVIGIAEAMITTPEVASPPDPEAVDPGFYPHPLSKPFRPIRQEDYLGNC